MTKHKGLEVKGSLVAEGLDLNEDKIVFTSICDDEYGGDTDNASTTCYWNRIHFAPSSDSSFFKNVKIRYGGVPDDGISPWRTIWIENSEVKFENVSLENNSGYDIYVEGNCPQLINTTFEKIYPLECSP